MPKQVGTVICGAKTQAGEPCKKAPIIDKLTGKPRNGRCATHRGNEPRGMLSPNYKHGRYSRFATEQLAEKVEQLKHDPDLLNMDTRIAEIQALRLDLTGRVVESGHIDQETRDILHGYIVEETKAIERRGKLEVQRGLVQVKFLDILVTACLEEMARELGDRDRAKSIFDRVIGQFRLPGGHEVATRDRRRGPDGSGVD